MTDYAVATKPFSSVVGLNLTQLNTYGNLSTLPYSFGSPVWNLYATIGVKNNVVIGAKPTLPSNTSALGTVGVSITTQTLSSFAGTMTLTSIIPQIGVANTPFSGVSGLGAVKVSINTATLTSFASNSNLASTPVAVATTISSLPVSTSGLGATSISISAPNINTRQQSFVVTGVLYPDYVTLTLTNGCPVYIPITYFNNPYVTISTPVVSLPASISGYNAPTVSISGAITPFSSYSNLSSPYVEVDSQAFSFASLSNYTNPIVTINVDQSNTSFVSYSNYINPTAATGPDMLSPLVSTSGLGAVWINNYPSGLIWNTQIINNSNTYWSNEIVN